MHILQRLLFRFYFCELLLQCVNCLLKQGNVP